MAPRWSLESSLEAIELSLDDDDDRDDDRDVGVDSGHVSELLHEGVVEEEDDDEKEEAPLNLDLDVDLDLDLDLHSEHTRNDVGVDNHNNDSKTSWFDDDDDDDIDSLQLPSPTVSEADEINDDDDDDAVDDNEGSDSNVNDIDDGGINGNTVLAAKEEERQQQQHGQLGIDDGSSSQSLTLSSSSSSSDDGSVSDLLLVSTSTTNPSVLVVSSAEPSSFRENLRLKSIMKPPPSPTSTARSAKQRSVSFCPMATILLHPHITEYTPSEIVDAWYSSVDLKQFRQDCLDVADRLEGSSTIISPSSKMDDYGGDRDGNSEEFCARGCEYKTRVGTMLRQKHRRDAMRAVFDYQDAKRAKQRPYLHHHHRHHHQQLTHHTYHQHSPKMGHCRGVASFIDPEELAQIYSTWTHHSQQVARIMGNIDRSAVIKTDQSISPSRKSKRSNLDRRLSPPVGANRQSSATGSSFRSIHVVNKCRQHRQYQDNSHDNNDERREEQEDHHERHRKQWMGLGVSSLFHHSSTSNSNERRRRNGDGNPSSPLMPTSPPAFSSMRTAFTFTGGGTGTQHTQGSHVHSPSTERR